jgi:hypothetical protein
VKASKKATSTAARVDAAWKRILSKHERFPFLPHDPAMLDDWDHLARMAADARAKLKRDDLTDLRNDYAIVERALGHIPPLVRR